MENKSFSKIWSEGNDLAIKEYPTPYYGGMGMPRSANESGRMLVRWTYIIKNGILRDEAENFVRNFNSEISRYGDNKLIKEISGAVGGKVAGKISSIVESIVNIAVQNKIINHVKNKYQDVEISSGEVECDFGLNEKVKVSFPIYKFKKIASSLNESIQAHCLNNTQTGK